MSTAHKFAAAAVAALLVPAAAFAQGVGATVQTTVQTNLETKAISRADQEIDRRVGALNAQVARLNQMQRLSADAKRSLIAGTQAQIDALTALKAQIDASTSTASLKAEVQSITKSYRIFALIMPQNAIVAAADRAVTIVGLLNTLGSKLAARVASSTGDTSAAQAALADLSAKINDANTQAQAAVTAVASLQADNGDKTIQASNASALKSARGDIQAAQADLVAARKDVAAVLQALHISAEASANASSTVQTQ